MVRDQEEELLCAPLLREHRRRPAQHVVEFLVVGHGGPSVMEVFERAFELYQTLPGPVKIQGLHLSVNYSGSPEAGSGKAPVCGRPT